MQRGWRILLLLTQLGGAHAALAGPSEQCRRAAAAAERRWALPAQLLLAIGRVESGRPDADSGQVQPWPWSANAAGAGYAFSSPLEARNVVGFLREHGIASIDVGCFQVNLHHHPTAFASVEEGFDPEANADYAARFLRQLYHRTGRWEAAIGDYHSADPSLGGDYRAKVLRAWHALRMEGAPVLAVRDVTFTPNPGPPLSVMPGLDPGIHAHGRGMGEWIAGSSPATTVEKTEQSAWDRALAPMTTGRTTSAIPVYTPRTLPASLRAALGLAPTPRALSEK